MSDIEEPADKGSFTYCTTLDLSIELGATPQKAQAIQARVERLIGNMPELIGTEKAFPLDKV